MVIPQIKIVQAQEMALGLFLEHRGQAVYFGHGGADVGFVCQMIANKDAGYGAAVMTNSDSMAGPLINEILQSIAVEYNWQDYVAPPVELLRSRPGTARTLRRKIPGLLGQCLDCASEGSGA